MKKMEAAFAYGKMTALTVYTEQGVIAAHAAKEAWDTQASRDEQSAFLRGYEFGQRIQMLRELTKSAIMPVQSE